MLRFLFFPLICGLIGWMTNHLAIMMLFHPRRPYRIFFWKVQGLFPKRQSELAERLGDLVEQELISHQDIRWVLNEPHFQQRLKELIRFYVQEFVGMKMKPLFPYLPLLITGNLLDKISALVVKEVESFIPEMVEQAALELERRLSIKELVRRKIEDFSIARLEEVIFALVKRELWFIEVTGGVLGCCIGLLQAFVWSF